MNKRVETKQDQSSDMQSMLSRQQFSDEIVGIIENENLLPAGLLKRLHGSYPQVSGLFRTGKLIFNGKEDRKSVV